MVLVVYATRGVRPSVRSQRYRAGRASSWPLTKSNMFYLHGSVQAGNPSVVCKLFKHMFIFYYVLGGVEDPKVRNMLEVGEPVEPGGSNQK